MHRCNWIIIGLMLAIQMSSQTIAIEEFREPLDEDIALVDACMQAAIGLVSKIDRFNCEVTGRFEALDTSVSGLTYETDFVFDWSEDLDANRLRVSYVSRLVSMNRPFPKLGKQSMNSFGNINRSFDALCIGQEKYGLGDIMETKVGEKEKLEISRLPQTAFSPLGIGYIGAPAATMPFLSMTIDVVSAFANSSSSTKMKRVCGDEKVLVAQWWFPVVVYDEAGKKLDDRHQIVEVVFDKTKNVPISRRSLSQTPKRKLPTVNQESRVEWKKFEDYWLPISSETYKPRNPSQPEEGFRKVTSTMKWKFDKEVDDKIFDRDDLGKARVLTLFKEGDTKRK